MTRLVEQIGASAAALGSLSREWAVVCDTDGSIIWADGRAKRAFGAHEGMSLVSMAASLNEGKVTRFLDAARSRRLDDWELLLRGGGGHQDGQPILFSVSGAPYAGNILIVGSQLPREYTAVQERLGATLNELAGAHREVVQRELGLAAAHRELVEKSAELDRLNRVLARTARIDPMTGLGNRLQLGEALALLHEQAEQHGRTYSLAFCDVDHFKKYNDHYGHPAGDQALRTIAETLAACSRRSDAVFRYGGEEILILFPDQGGADAVSATERACRAVRVLGIPHVGNPGGGIVTLSAGIGSFHPGTDTRYEDVIGRADAALYRAKALGRDRVVVEEETLCGTPG